MAVAGGRTAAESTTPVRGRPRWAMTTSIPWSMTTRLAYSEVLPDEKDATCAAFLPRAADYFAAHGIPRIERVMTDNARAYRCSLRHVVAALDAKQLFIKPHCPWQNGKVERLNRTLQTEWASRQVFTSNAGRTAALAPSLEHYNTQRPHSALAGRPPISRLLPT